MSRSESMIRAHREGRAFNRRVLKSRGVSYPERYFNTLLRNVVNDKSFETEFRIGKYYGDFVWPHKKIVLEIDGEQHKFNKSYDDARDLFMQSYGWTVVRIPWQSYLKDKTRFIDELVQYVDILSENSSYYKFISDSIIRSKFIKFTPMTYTEYRTNTNTFQCGGLELVIHHERRKVIRSGFQFTNNWTKVLSTIVGIDGRYLTNYVKTVIPDLYNDYLNKSTLNVIIPDAVDSMLLNSVEPIVITDQHTKKSNIKKNLILRCNRLGLRFKFDSTYVLRILRD